MAPDDHFDYEVRGAVVRGLVPLMRVSGYRAEAVGISESGAIRLGNGYVVMWWTVLIERGCRVGFWRRHGLGVRV